MLVRMLNSASSAPVMYAPPNNFAQNQSVGFQDVPLAQAAAMASLGFTPVCWSGSTTQRPPAPAAFPPNALGLGPVFYDTTLGIFVSPNGSGAWVNVASGASPV